MFLQAIGRGASKLIQRVDHCTYEGSHCQGCGRSHQEIANTKKLVMSIANFIKSQDYENSEEFVNTISKSVLKKLQNPA